MVDERAELTGAGRKLFVTARWKEIVVDATEVSSRVGGDVPTTSTTEKTPTTQSHTDTQIRSRHLETVAVSSVPFGLCVTVQCMSCD